MKTFTTLAILLLALAALAQALRAILGWEVIIAGSVVPLWLSAVVAAVLGTIAFLAWRENRRN